MVLSDGVRNSWGDMWLSLLGKMDAAVRNPRGKLELGE